MAADGRRKILTLDDRVDVLKWIDNGESCRSRQLLIVGRARSAEFVVVKEWESGARYDLKYLKRRKGPYEELNTLVWEWFNKAQFTTYILCSHFQYTVTRVPNLCIAIHGNVYVHVHSVDMFVKIRAMSCYKFGSF